MRGSLTRSKDDKADVALCGRYIADLLDRCDGEGDAGDGDGEEGKEVKNRQSYQWTTALRKAFILFAFVIILDLGWSQGWEGECDGSVSLSWTLGGVRDGRVSVKGLCRFPGPWVESGMGG